MRGIIRNKTTQYLKAVAERYDTCLKCIGLLIKKIFGGNISIGDINLIDSYYNKYIKNDVQGVNFIPLDPIFKILYSIFSLKRIIYDMLNLYDYRKGVGVGSSQVVTADIIPIVSYYLVSIGSVDDNETKFTTFTYNTSQGYGELEFQSNDISTDYIYGLIRNNCYVSLFSKLKVRFREGSHERFYSFTNGYPGILKYTLTADNQGIKVNPYIPATNFYHFMCKYPIWNIGAFDIGAWVEVFTQIVSVGYLIDNRSNVNESINKQKVVDVFFIGIEEIEDKKYIKLRQGLSVSNASIPLSRLTYSVLGLFKLENSNSNTVGGLIGELIDVINPEVGITANTTVIKLGF